MTTMLLIGAGFFCFTAGLVLGGLLGSSGSSSDYEAGMEAGRFLEREVALLRAAEKEAIKVEV